MNLCDMNEIKALLARHGFRFGGCGDKELGTRQLR